jgi:hypothetical protein
MVATSTGGTENALASIDVPMNGNLIGVEWACNSDMDVTGDDQVWQLSFGSTSSVANDSRQVISNLNMGGYVHLTAVGAVVSQGNRYTPLPDVPVGMGERLYLHSIAAAGVVGRAMAVLHFDFDLDKVQVRRR